MYDLCTENVRHAIIRELEQSRERCICPCSRKHTVGSDYIATWLRDHNTCSVCRHEFFPAERTADDDEDDEFNEDCWDDQLIMDNMHRDSDDEDSDEEEEKRELRKELALAQLQSLCHLLCAALNLDTPHNLVKIVASLVAFESLGYVGDPRGEFLGRLQPRGRVCVFVAARLVRMRIRMRDIARVAPVTRRSVSVAYRTI